VVFAGSVGRPGAAELKSTSRDAHYLADMWRRILDLIEVTSIDRNGEAVLAEDTQQAPTQKNGHLMTHSNSQSKGAQDTLTKIMLGDVAGVSDLEIMRPLISQ
jgi:hypothetical protein